MTNSPPPDPRSSPLGFDELVGIVIAFTAIGTILAWALTQKDKGFNPTSLDPGSAPVATPSPQAQAPSATIDPTTPETPTPSVLPGETPFPQQTAPVIPFSPVNPTSPSPQKPSKNLGIAPVPVPGAAKSPAPVKPTPASAVKFSDVPNNFWARPYIASLTTKGIFKGSPNGTFRPDQTMTRAEFAVLLEKAFEEKPTIKPPNFKDVPSGSSVSPAIKQIATTGFLRGYPGNIFRPKQEIPKVQVLVALANGLELKQPPNPEKVLQTYQDAGQIPKYATKPVAAATQAGIVLNYPDTKSLNPNKPATRAEVAALVYQALVKAGKAEKVSSKYTVAPR